MPVPDSVDAAEAAAIVLNYATAYQILHREAKLAQGASFIVVQGAWARRYVISAGRCTPKPSA